MVFVNEKGEEWDRARAIPVICLVLSRERGNGSL